MSDDILRIIIDKVDKLDGKIDGIGSDIVEIKITSARHDENLKMHMKRSDAAEEGINLLKEALVPIKSHIHSVESIIKFVAVSSGIVGAIGGVLKFFGRI